MSETKESLRAELAQAKRDIKDWQDSSEAYRLDAERAEARIADQSVELELLDSSVEGLRTRAERAEALREWLDKEINAHVPPGMRQNWDDGYVYALRKARARLNPSPAEPSC